MAVQLGLVENHSTLDAFSATLQLDAQFPPGASPACAFLSPFDALSCLVGSNTLLSTQITGAAILQARVFAANGNSTDTLNSNTLSTKVFHLRLLSNTVGNAGATDDTRNLVVYNNLLFFSSNNTYPRSKVMTYNDVTDEIDQIFQINNNSTGDPSSALRVAGGNIVLVGGDVYLYNPTDMLRLITSGFANPIFTTWGTDELYFRASVGGIFPPYRLVASTGVLTQVSHLGVGFTLPCNGVLFAESNNDVPSEAVFKISSDGATFEEVSRAVNNDAAFFCDGTRAYWRAQRSGGGHDLVMYDTVSGGPAKFITATSPSSDFPEHLTLYNGKIVLSLRNVNSVAKLYQYDAAEDELTLLSNTSESASIADAPGKPFEWGGKLYLSMNNPSGASKLYVYDGTKFSRLSNTSDDEAQPDSPQGFAVYNGALYFSAKNASGASKLYRYSPTEGTLLQVASTSGSDTVSDDPNHLTVYKTRLYFSSNSGALNIRKLFRLCDPAAGCVN